MAYHSSRGGSSRRRKKKAPKPQFDPRQFINKNPAPAEPEPDYEAEHDFKDFPVDRRLVGKLESMGIVTPSPIQDKIIHNVLDGHDVIGLAETGTGKTLAFLFPLIHKTFAGQNRKTLILTPTRELAIQIAQEFRKLSGGMRLGHVVCVGGSPIRFQIRDLKRPHEFLIGTPGRVMDLIDKGHINPKAFDSVVLDEADRMLDMGFINDMRQIVLAVPESRQTLFFSATMTKEAERVSDEFLTDPITVAVKKTDVTSSVVQDVVEYVPHLKFERLHELLEDPAMDRVIIFVERKHLADDLAYTLQDVGIETVSLHGDKEHRQRQIALKQFKDGKARVLVATDVAARGIHVDDVSHVINYDLPQQFEDYVHRIGRTGRGDKRGIALSFVTN